LFERARGRRPGPPKGRAQDRATAAPVRGALQRRPSTGLEQVIEEVEVPGGSEPVEEPEATAAPFAPQACEDRPREAQIAVGQLASMRVDPFDEDVEVADPAEELAQPPQLFADPLDRSEDRLEGLEVRAQTAGGDARVVDRFGIAARTDLGIVAQQRQNVPRDRVWNENIALGFASHARTTISGSGR